jgi:hypothetical protein
MIEHRALPNVIPACIPNYVETVQSAKPAFHWTLILDCSIKSVEARRVYRPDSPRARLGALLALIAQDRLGDRSPPEESLEGTWLAR